MHAQAIEYLGLLVFLSAPHVHRTQLLTLHNVSAQQDLSGTQAELFVLQALPALKIQVQSEEEDVNAIKVFNGIQLVLYAIKL